LQVALVAAAVLVWWGCSRCHTGHYEVRHYEASSSVSCTSFDDDLDCTVDTDPEHCAASFVCDIYCEALDKGRQEAHTQHATLRQVKDTVDPRCTWDGTHARLR